MVAGKQFVNEKEKLIVGGRNWHKEFCYLYSQMNSIRAITSRNVRRTAHVARIRENENKKQ